jgi:hypothetical protein
LKELCPLFKKEIIPIFLQNGFFVEAGAASCDFDSVTLPFELQLGWTGRTLFTFLYAAITRYLYHYGVIPWCGKFFKQYVPLI